MRGHTTGAGILLGLATAIMTAPIAFAQDEAQDEVPYLAAPGELLRPGNELQIQGYCPDPDAGPLTSPALTSIEVLHDPASAPPNLTASGVVAEGTEPGSYPVTMECLGETLQVVFTVIDAETPATPPSLTLQPTTVRPGDRVTATAECDESDTATLASRVLRTVELTRDPDGHQPWAVRGTTTVDPDADPGTYEVELQCGTQRATAVLTVLSDEQQVTEPSDGRQVTVPSDGRQVTRTPVGAPETGAPDPQYRAGALLVGTALVAACGVAALRWARR